MQYTIELEEGKLPHNFVIGTRAGETVFCAQNRYTSPNEVGGSSQTKHSNLAKQHSLETIIGAGTCHIPVNRPATLFINRRGSDGDIIRYPVASKEAVEPFLQELLTRYNAINSKIERIDLYP